MKRLFTLFFVLLTFTAFSQQYNNEWIDFSKTYYKFKVGATGLYRIPLTTLTTVGLGTTSAEQFRLFRNGREVPIYTSEPTGPLSVNGFIEFWGEANDGKADNALYREPAYQHSDKISLQTDTSTYFLTISSSTNLRLADQLNDAASTTMLPESYFMYTTGRYYQNKINPGFSKYAGEYVYSSSYDYGEYWSSGDIYPGNPLNDNLSNLAVYAAGPSSFFRFGASGNAPNQRTMNVNLNSTFLQSGVVMNEFQHLSPTPIEIPTSLISSGNASVSFSNLSGVTNDRMVVSFFDLTYPRKFDFGASKNFSFELPAKNDPYYLAITNFNRGAISPILYDLTYGKRYTAIYSTIGDTLKFLLPAGTLSRKLVLVNQETTNISQVTSLVSKTFTNYSISSNQGDYLIISNPILYNGPNGTNPVMEYRDYRNSTDGGSYNAKVIDINELVDQFAFGIKKHPLSIKNYMRYARDIFVVKPKYLFLIGRGVDYINYRNNENKPLIEALNLIPSFGSPASDNFLTSLDSKSALALTPIGRLSVVHPYEIQDYLQKMKEYELAQRTAPNTLEKRLWMKNIMHVTGASATDLGVTLCNFMHGYKNILEDTLTGTKVHMFCKSSANPVEELSSENISRLFEEGLSMLTYFGHSSSTTLEFNIDKPENYNNQGKYPVFSVNGCNAGNFFTYYPQRLSLPETLSEKFVLAKQRGGIAFIASTHFGIVNYLNIYVNNLYKNISNQLYGESLGLMNEIALRRLMEVTTTPSGEDFYARCHSEEITLHGDPVLKMNFQEKPDYVLEDAQIKISPSFISIAENEFDLNIKMFNLGKAINDSSILEIKRLYPDGTTEILTRKNIKGILYSDSISMKVPVISTRDKGANKIIISLDADNSIAEMDESNNIVSKDFYVYEDEARPTFPYNYAIVTDPLQKLFFSTADPFSKLKEYTIEIDTTELFSSSIKESKNVNIEGGLIEFDPSRAYVENVVYYWRVGVAQLNGEKKWNTFSFIFLPNSSAGFNQSHFFQFDNNTFKGLDHIESIRKSSFQRTSIDFNVRTGVYPHAGFSSDYALNWGLNTQDGFSGPYEANLNCLRFYVIDGKTLDPWVNIEEGVGGLYGSLSPVALNPTGHQGFFHFDISTTSRRKILMDFLDLIPAGNYIAMSNTPGHATILPEVWQSDTSVLGSNNSLFHKLRGLGFTVIDDIHSHVPFLFIYKKGDPGIIRQELAVFPNDLLSVSFSAKGFGDIGTMTSDLFGPSKKWNYLHVKGNLADPPSDDTTASAIIDILGVTTTGTEVLLHTFSSPFGNAIPLDFIDAATYPNLKLRLTTSDTANYSPYDLAYWRINADFVPEGALAPNLLFKSKDTLDVGEILNFAIAFKNVSQPSFDSMKVKLIVIDRDNRSRLLDTIRIKPLLSGDTAMVRYSIDTKDYPGNNILSVDFNPDGDLPEQYHYNNFLFTNFYVRPDKTNPLMDITFDGIHILNKDIVSSKPKIEIRLKDEAKFMLLNDSSLITDVQVRYPDMNNTLRSFKFDNDTLRFRPAESGTDNTAVIEFAPYFPTILSNDMPLNPEGDDYELVVKAKDRSGNNAGHTEYRVSFKVIDKPMISNLLNYPNPFTTSTAFVFTLTGSEIPQNIKIQILTITGKIVREITKEELGPLHIGRNITEFKWNGTDQYGQRLANGVYLYRVVTTLNGKRMDKFQSQNDNTDKYFNNGYGKMYLMR